MFVCLCVYTGIAWNKLICGYASVVHTSNLLAAVVNTNTAENKHHNKTSNCLGTDIQKRPNSIFGIYR